MIREFRDQRPFDGSPGLIAVFRALRRLLAPRHPPHALSSLAALAPGPPDAAAGPVAVCGCYRGPRLRPGGQSNDPRFSRAHAEIACETASPAGRPADVRNLLRNSC